MEIMRFLFLVLFAAGVTSAVIPWVLKVLFFAKAYYEPYVTWVIGL